MEKLQLERLKWQVERCYKNSEFYRERFDEIGLKPDDIKSLDDIGKIPPVTKEELRQEQINSPAWQIYCRSSEGLERAPSINRNNRYTGKHYLDPEGRGKFNSVDGQDDVEFRDPSRRYHSE